MDWLLVKTSLSQISGMKERRRSVCLFGLSADPVTGNEGHVGIVKALQQHDEWDEIWVLPVYRHTFSVRNLIDERPICNVTKVEEGSAYAATLFSFAN